MLATITQMKVSDNNNCAAITNCLKNENDIRVQIVFLKHKYKNLNLHFFLASLDVVVCFWLLLLVLFVLFICILSFVMEKDRV